MIISDCNGTNPTAPFNSYEYKGRSYLFSRNTKSWVDAKNECKGLNGCYDLLSIMTKDENEFVVDMVETEGNPRPWIGLNDIGTEGNLPNNFSWIDGSGRRFGLDVNVGQYPWYGGNPVDVSFL